MGKQSSDELLRELARAMTVFDLTTKHEEHGAETVEAAEALSEVADKFLVLIVGHAKLNKWFNKDEEKFFKERPDWLTAARRRGWDHLLAVIAASENA